MKHEGANASSTGRWIVLIAGGVGIAAIIGYGVLQDGTPEHVATEHARDAVATAPITAQTAEFDDLVARVRKARRSLDVVTLAELAQALQHLAQRTELPTRHLVELELADALATRALEATIRGAVLSAEKDDAERVTGSTLAALTPLLHELDDAGVDPSRLHAVRARVALAQGDDALEEHPALMLPTYRDEELRLAALAGPLWREAEVSPDLVRDLVDALLEAEQDSGLTRALLALALRAQGDDDGALSVLEAMLEQVPSQPTANALRAELIDASAIEDEPEQPLIVASAEPSEDLVPEATKRDDTKAFENDAPPDVRPVATSEPSTSTPKASKGDKKPKPSTSDTNSPRTSGFDALATEGCKKVQSGDASAGLALLSRAFDMRPGAVKVIVCMAEAHHKLGRAASARAMAERALSKSPKNLRALALMATLEDERGNRSGAQRYYRKILEVEPNHAKAKAYVGG